MSENNTSSRPPSQPLPPWEDLVRQVPRLKEAVTLYLQASLQKLKVSLKKDLFQTLFWVFIALLAFQALYVCLSLLVHGAGEGLGLALGNRIWLGNIIVGGGLLALVLAGIKFALMRLHRSAKKYSVQPSLAQEKIQESLVALQKDVRGFFKIRTWVEQYPLPTAGAVAILGFWMGGRLVHEGPAGRENELEVPSTDFLLSLSNILLTTFSDVVKDAAHLWVQKNLDTSPSPNSEIPS